ncbi:hypothetical protein [Flavobacterium sp.]|uniref:hypothetical protein n=1 Tax=Flavobacterium sp. TaxID=239 RepID=UPI002FDB5486
MRLFIPIILIALFVFYVLYLALIKKELKQNLTGVLYPGLFFIVVWGILYYIILE